MSSSKNDIKINPFPPSLTDSYYIMKKAFIVKSTALGNFIHNINLS